MASNESDEDVVQEQLEPNGFSIFSGSLQQEVLKIHDATRLALPTFADSSDSDSDSENNLTLIRPKHLTSSLIHDEETHIKYASMKEGPADEELRIEKKRVFPEESWKIVENQNLEEAIEESFRLLVEDDIKERNKDLKDMFKFDLEKKLSTELIEQGKVDECVLPLTGLSSASFNTFLEDLHQAESTWETTSKKTNEKKNDGQVLEKTEAKSKSIEGDDSFQQEGSAEMTWVLDYLEKQSKNMENNDQDDDDDGVVPQLPHIPNTPSSDMLYPPIPPETETSTTKLSTNDDQLKKASIADQLLEFSTGSLGHISTGSTNTLYDIKKTQHDAEVRGETSPKAKKASFLQSQVMANNNTKTMADKGKGGKGGKGNYSSMDFNSDDGSSDSDDDVDWRKKRAQAKQERGLGSSTTIQSDQQPTTSHVQDAWGGASLSAQQQRQRMKSSLAAKKSAIHSKQANENDPTANLLRELLSSEPTHEDEEEEDDDVNEDDEEDDDDDDVNQVPVEIEEADEDDISLAVKAYTETMKMHSPTNKQSEPTEKKDSLKTSTVVKEEEDHDEDSSQDVVLGFLSNLAKASEDAIESLNVKTNNEEEEEEEDDNDDDVEDESEEKEEVQINRSIVSKNEKILSEKLKQFEESSSPSSSSSLSPSSQDAVNSLDMVRKAALKSLGSIPKNRKVFHEIVPNSILNKPLRTLPMEYWSDVFPCLDFDPNENYSYDTHNNVKNNTSLSSTSISLTQSRQEKFNEKVKNVHVVAVKENDVKQLSSSSSSIPSFLAWLMKLSHVDAQHSSSHMFHATLLSLNLTTAILKPISTNDNKTTQPINIEKKNNKQKKKQKQKNNDASVTENVLKEFSISLSEPQETSASSSVIYLFAISLPQSESSSLSQIQHLENLFKTSPLPLSCFALIKTQSPQTNTIQNDDNDDDEDDEFSRAFHPLELFSRLPSFRSWQPLSLDESDKAEDEDDDNEEEEEENGDVASVAEDKDLLSNTSDVAVCVLKSYLHEDEDEKTLTMILTRLLSGSGTSSSSSSSTLNQTNMEETPSSSTSEEDRSLNTNGSYLIGFRMIHLDHNQLFPPSAESFISYSTLEYLKTLEGYHEGGGGGQDHHEEKATKVLYVLAFRGGGTGCPCSEKLNQILGPKDPILAKATDPTSLRALYGKNNSKNLAVVPIGITLYKEFACWFGGRIYDNAITHPSSPSSSSSSPSSSSPSSSSLLKTNVYNRLKPAPSIILKKREIVMLSLWQNHASRLGDIIKISSLYGLSLCHMQLLTYDDIEIRVLKDSKQNESLLDLYEWLKQEQKQEPQNKEEEKEGYVKTISPNKRRALCIWFESEMASVVVSNMLASSSIASAFSSFGSSSHGQVEYDLKDCFSCLDMDKSLLSILTCQLNTISSLKTIKKSSTSSSSKISVSHLEISGSDFHRADKVSTDKSLPQTLVCVLPCASTNSSSISMAISELLNKLLKSHHTSSSSHSSSPTSSSHSSSPTGSQSFDHMASDALPFELLAMKVFKKLSHLEANRIVSSCCNGSQQDTIVTLTQTPVIILAIRCVEGRRKIKNIIQTEEEYHHQYSFILPSVFVGKAPRSTLSLLALFFPCYKLIDRRNNSLKTQQTNNSDGGGGGGTRVINSLSADENYPVPSRGLACLPSSFNKTHHPLLEYFISPHLPSTSTISIISPQLCWLQDHQYASPTSSSSSSPTSSQMGYGSRKQKKKPSILIRILKRIEKENLTIDNLGLKELTPEQWAVVPEFYPSSSSPLIVNEDDDNSQNNDDLNIQINEMSGLSTLLRISGVHATSSWADCVGPSQSMVDYLSNNNTASTSSTSSLLLKRKNNQFMKTPKENNNNNSSDSFLDKSIDFDMHCLRGVVNMKHLLLNDMGIYASQSVNDTTTMLQTLSQQSNINDDDNEVLNKNTKSDFIPLVPLLGGHRRRFVKEGISMVETTSIVIVHELIQQVGLSSILDTLVREDFDLVQLKMGSFSSLEQAEEFLSLVSPTQSHKNGEHDDKVIMKEELLKGPIAILVVEKDHAIHKLNSLIYEGKHEQTHSNYMAAPSFRNTHQIHSHSSHNNTNSLMNSYQGMDNDEEDNVFKYTSQNPPNSPLIQHVSENENINKFGVICPLSPKEAENQILFFFERIYGVHRIE